MYIVQGPNRRASDTLGTKLNVYSLTTELKYLSCL